MVQRSQCYSVVPPVSPSNAPLCPQCIPLLAVVLRCAPSIPQCSQSHNPAFPVWPSAPSAALLHPQYLSVQPHSVPSMAQCSMWYPAVPPVSPSAPRDRSCCVPSTAQCSQCHAHRTSQCCLTVSPLSPSATLLHPQYGPVLLPVPPSPTTCRPSVPRCPYVPSVPPCPAASQCLPVCPVPLCSSALRCSECRPCPHGGGVLGAPVSCTGPMGDILVSLWVTSLCPWVTPPRTWVTPVPSGGTSTSPCVISVSPYG